jgi:hypothetical protein
VAVALDHEDPDPAEVDPGRVSQLDLAAPRAARIRSSGIRSSARRAMGPVVLMRQWAPEYSGNCPVPGTSPPVGLCPNTPLQNAGTRIEPPKSVPIPKGEPQAETIAASPPELPPAE